MKKKVAAIHRKFIYGFACFLLLFAQNISNAQTLAFPGAQGFGRFAKGARGTATREVYIVTNLNDAGAGSFRDAVSRPGRIVVFAVSGIVYLSTDVVVSPNVTIAGQTAPGEGIVFFNKRVTFSSASNTIARYLRIRLGATGNSGNDASGLSNGSNMIFDHMSFSWAMDEVFSINWDGKGTAPDSITVQNSIIGQGLHRENHSAGGLIQTPDGGKVSLLRNLYISNKTRNPKVKGVNEFVNNVVYNWGNGNRLADNLNYGWSGDAYIMGGSSGVSEVNIINNYFVGGPLTPPSKTTPFSRGTGTFNLYASGNYFDNDKDGQLNGTLVPYTDAGYPGITADAFKAQPFPYPAASPALTAEQAYQLIIDSVGASYPRRDQVDNLMVDEVKSKGLLGMYVYRETDLPLANGGLGNVFSAPAPLDSDSDGMPDAWEDANGLNKNNKQDAVAFSTTYPEYLNIEVYINSLVSVTPPVFVKPPSAVTLSATSVETPPSSTIVINWVDNSSNEDHFVIERSEDNVTFTEITQPAANATTYSDATGLPNKTYYYRIKAVAGAEASVFSAAAMVKTPQIPTAPSEAATPSPGNGFQYAEPVGGKLTLKWTGSANTEKYEVYFGTSASSLTKKGEMVYSATPSYEVTGLTDLTTYYWRVDAINSKGTTDGPVWSFRTTKAVEQGLVGYWSFDGSEGRVVTDSTAYQNHGLLGLDDDDQSIRVAGHEKNALDFATADPNMYVVSIPNGDQLYLDKGSFSLSFWMKADATLLPPDNNSSAYLLCKGSITRNATTGATGKRFDIEFKNKQFRFAIDDDNDANGGGKDELQTDGTPFFSGDWVHVIAMRDTTAGKLRVYLNGGLVKEQNISKAKSGIGEVSSLILGNIGELEFLASTNKPAPYKGMLDELKIYNYALTYPEIVTLYYGSPIPQKPLAPSYNDMTVDGYSDTLKLTWQGGVNTTKFRLFMGPDANNLVAVADSISVDNPLYALANVKGATNYFWRVDAIGMLGTTTGDVWSFRTGLPRGLVAHYAFDEESGVTATDSTEYANNGIFRDLPNAVWMGGKYKNALGFGKPGSTGGIVIPDAQQIRFEKGSFAISLWAKLPAYNTVSGKYDAYLIHKGTMENVSAGTGKWYGIQLKDRTLSFGIDDGINKVSADVSIAAGTTYDIFNKGWVHIVAVRDRSINRIRVYINGVMAKSVDDSKATGSIGKDSDLLIGNSPENKSFPDSLDDVRLYNYALSEAAINKLYNSVPLLKKVNTPAPAHYDVAAGPERVNFSWNDPTGTALSYKLYFGTAPDSLQLEASGLTTAEFMLDSLRPTKQYYWRVEAASDIETTLSDLWTFTTASDTTRPSIITKDISVELNTSGTAVITAADVNNGSHDVYGIDSLGLDQTTFSCANIGENVVTLTAKDKNGNEASQTAIVTVNGIKPGKPVINPADTVICSGFSANLRALVDTAVTYQWYYEGVAISNAKNHSYAAYNAGNYAVQAISAQSCKSDTSEVAMVRISGDTLLTVERDAELSKGASVQLTASGSEGSITWSPFLASSHKEGRTTTVTPLQTTRYTATLVNPLGCKVSRSVLIKVADKFSNEYNNILTPNGDGINDRLVIKNLNGYPNNRLQVFDYSGKVIYQQNGYSNDWDGTINGRKAANGTYYFVLMINNEVKIKGSVTIVK